MGFEKGQGQGEGWKPCSTELTKTSDRPGIRLSLKSAYLVRVRVRARVRARAKGQGPAQLGRGVRTCLGLGSGPVVCAPSVAEVEG